MLRDTYTLVTTNVLKKVSLETFHNIVQLEQAAGDLQTVNVQSKEEITTSEAALSLEPLEEDISHYRWYIFLNNRNMSQSSVSVTHTVNHLL